MAAALAYLAAGRLGLNVRKRVIVVILGVSKLSIRDTAYRLGRYAQKEAAQSSRVIRPCPVAPDF